MLPYVNKVYSFLAYTARVIYRASVLRNMTAQSYKKVQARHKEVYERRFQYKPRSVEVGNVFVEHLRLTASAANEMAYKVYRKVQLRHRGPYFVINVGP